MMKRQSQDDPRPRLDGASSDDKRRRRVPSLRSVIMEVVNMRRVQHFMEPVLEPLIRRVVKEEVELALRKYMTSMKRNCGKDVYACELRSLKLKFLDLISPPVFTGTRIEGEESSLKIALVDVLTGKVICSGPESCAKVEIVVLEGDFDSDDGDNWTSEEFKSNIVREREGKKPLLTGDAFLYLKEGIGWVSDISFTDNSSWTRSRKFRLGARVVDSFEGISVREAKTESFIVRDHRGELYKKHHPPSLSDEFSSSSPLVGNSDASDNVLTSQKVSRSEYQQLSASTPDIMPSFCSIAGFSSLDDYVLHGIDNMDVRFDQPLNFPGQDTNTLMADTDSITPPSFCDDDLPFFDTNYSLPSPGFAPSPDLQCAVNSFLAHSSAIVPLDKAQRRWKMLFSVLRWFSVRRIVNRRTIIS
ncbi:Calmodulin-binding protein 60 D [Capsicum annuum]|uniref:Calmodulin-binding protein 60 D n=1 Tax=Capsicum annuum TaxID=4072 RepID=A0A2G2Y6R0_CAPAN|nr:Calmodulin-binding protein 60 D [Capsicum annuum]